ncbi:MAG: SH3 domain-containing protein [Anaerolineae bacterium]
MTRSVSFWAGIALVLLLAIVIAVLSGRVFPQNATTAPLPLPTPASSAPTASADLPRPAFTISSTVAASVATPVLAVSPAPVVVRSVRVMQDVSVYRQSDAGSAVVARLVAGASVTVTDERGDWLEVIVPTAPGGHGWIAQSALAAAPAATAAPVEPVPAAVDAAASTSAAAEQPAQPVPAAVLAAPAGPALHGKLVFQESNGGSIYLINADGSGLRRLTYGFDPALSPNGQQVAFTRWDEPRGLWVINVDGSGARQLFTANKPRSPSWAVDGQSIVFEQLTRTRTCRESPFGCLTDDEMRAEFGGGDCLSTPFGSFCIADFPVVTLSYTGLVQVDLATGTGKDLPTSETATSPRFTPNASTVFYLDGYTMALAQTRNDDPPQQILVSNAPVGPANYSPDGQWLYGTRRGGSHWDIWRWRADGSQSAALTTSDPLAAQAANNVAPAVSRDGQSVIFLTDRAGSWQLWVMNSDGSNQRPFAADALAGIALRYDWSADRVVDWGP